MKKYIVNEDYFNEIDTENKAYILGFLYADGCVSTKYFEITLHKKDKEILDFIRKELFINNRPLSEIRNDYIRLHVNSISCVQNLIKHGCTPTKTFSLKFPEFLPENLVRHFIRGYFDGDGCVYVNNNTLNYSFVGTINFLTELMKRLSENCNQTTTKLDCRHPERNNNIRALRYGGNQRAKKFFDYLYNESHFFLTRKHEIFQSILNTNRFIEKKISNRARNRILYKEQVYTKSKLALIISQEYNIKATTILSRLRYGWSIDEIINNNLNHHPKNK